jgi:hypothetical protein
MEWAILKVFLQQAKNSIDRLKTAAVFPGKKRIAKFVP